MAQVLLWAGLAVVSFDTAAVLVLAVVRAAERVDARARAGRWAPRRAEPAWWPEFERAFADYVRAGDGGRS
jgi:hypothetical protein